VEFITRISHSLDLQEPLRNTALLPLQLTYIPANSSTTVAEIPSNYSGTRVLSILSARHRSNSSTTRSTPVLSRPRASSNSSSSSSSMSIVATSVFDDEVLELLLADLPTARERLVGLLVDLCEILTHIPFEPTENEEGKFWYEIRCSCDGSAQSVERCRRCLSRIFKVSGRHLLYCDSNYCRQP
jgi:hypothetical protein